MFSHMHSIIQCDSLCLTRHTHLPLRLSFEAAVGAHVYCTGTTSFQTELQFDGFFRMLGDLV
jgi:hypothetical protein